MLVLCGEWGWCVCVCGGGGGMPRGRELHPCAPHPSTWCGGKGTCTPGSGHAACPLLARRHFLVAVVGSRAAFAQHARGRTKGRTRPPEMPNKELAFCLGGPAEPMGQGNTWAHVHGVGQAAPLAAVAALGATSCGCPTPVWELKQTHAIMQTNRACPRIAPSARRQPDSWLAGGRHWGQVERDVAPEPLGLVS
jgi:hypothetical protein